MTIALGLLCEGGAVVGADREVTYEGVTDSQVKTHIVGFGSTRIALAGAGSARLIRLAAEEIDRLGRSQPEVISPDEARAIVWAAYEKIKVHLDPNRGVTLDLVASIKATHAPLIRLMSIVDGIPNWEENYAVVGYGSHLARYLLKGLYRPSHRPIVARGVLLAAHVIKTVKDNVPYCGDETDLVYMQKGLVTDFVPTQDIAMHEQTAARIMTAIQPVLLSMTDINTTKQQLDDTIGALMAELFALRSNAFIQEQDRKLKGIAPSASPLVLVDGNEGSSAVSSLTHLSLSPVVFTDAQGSPSNYTYSPDDDDDEKPKD